MKSKRFQILFILSTAILAAGIAIKSRELMALGAWAALSTVVWFG